MSTDDRNSDHDLKAYLDGRDGVSAAYRKTAHEEPSRTLDAAILKAARKQHRPSTEAWYASRKPYAIAASLMIAVVAASLYFNAIDEVVVPAAERQESFIAVNLQRAQDAAETAEAPEAPPAVADAPRPANLNVVIDPAFETRQLPAPVPTVGAEDSAAALAAGAGISADTLARTAEPPVAVIDGPMLEAIEAEAQESRLEEIVVTGARIMRRDQGDVSYRESREDWLAEIRAMTDEFEARSQLATARASAARMEDQINEEIDLFLEVYPNADIEAELEALEE